MNYATNASEDEIEGEVGYADSIHDEESLNRGVGSIFRQTFPD